MLPSFVRSVRSAAVFASLLGAFSCGEPPTAPHQVEIAVARPTTASLTAPALVISQVYGGGGNASAPYLNDFIEIFNPGSSPVSLTGWSVQYQSSTGTTWAATALSGTIPAGGYFLVKEGSGGAVGTALPTADVTGTLNLSATIGKVLLASQTAAFTGSCASGANVVDIVAFGGVSGCGTTTPAPSNTTAVLRGGSGCTYTGSPAADFATGAPSPRNSASPANVCSTPATPASVAVAPDSTGVVVGNTVTFTATAKDAGGNPVGTTFTWASADPTVATVTAAGVATGIAAGFTTITATSANGITATAKLSVKPSTIVSHAGEVVISQVYGAGGNSGAAYKNDYIEIFNRSTQPVDLTGWSVQYASTTGGFSQVTPLSGTLASGKYLLIAEAAGSGNGVDLPTADITGTINMSGSAGKVLLIQSTTAAGAICANGGGNALVDFVAFGSGNNCAPATPAPTALNAATRKSGGCYYTPDNALDFVSVAAAPRNSASPARSCVVGPLDHVTLTAATPTVLAGATDQLTATALDANDNIVTTATFTWSTSDATIATVSATGLVTGVAANATPATITVSVDAGGVTKTASLDVPVATDGINWIDVSSSSTSFPPGFQTQLFATARVQSGGTIIPATFTFTSLDPQYMTVQNVANTAILTGVSAPTDGSKPRLQITATPTAGGTPYTFISKPVTIEVPVNSPPGSYANNEEFGDPTPASASNPDDFIIRRPQYALSYNQSRGTPNWVSYELDARQMVSGQDRCNCFTADPLLPAAKQIYTSDYTSGGFDRGHMARSADRTLANTDNASTFYLTNIVPQYADLNQGVWAQFENALADSARAGRAVYIITGPLYTQGKALTYVKNEGKIAIPDSTWKVALIGPMGPMPFGTANVQSWNDLAGLTLMAVNMPNTPGVRNNPWSMYLTTVDKIEASTGYDFLSLLQTGFQPALDYKDHAPVARVTSSGDANAGATITFDATTSSDADIGRADLGRVEALTFNWQFSDGSTATGPTVSRTFAVNGTLTATVTVTDAFGWPSVATTSVTITNVAPTATFTAPETTVEGTAFTIALTNATDPSPADAAALTFAFDCGNGYGTAGTSSSASCTPADNGNVTVRGKVIDPAGAFTEYTFTVAVTNAPPTATFTAPATVARGSSFALALTNATDPSSADVAAGFGFAFDCGNGFGADGGAAAATCAALHSGTVSARGRITDKDGGKSEYTAPVIVTAVPPQAIFAATPTVTEGAPFTMSLTGGTGAVAGELLQYAFDCGAGYGPLGPMASVSCATNDQGVRTVRGKVVDSEGTATEYTGSVTVTSVAPTAVFTAPTNTTRGYTYAISLSNVVDPSSADVGAGFSYAFDCGSGFGAAGADASRTCTAMATGTTTVRGRVIDKDGAFTEYQAAVAIADPIVMAALVRHAPTLNARVDGDVQMLLGENVTLNGGAAVNGKLFVPGTPTLRKNGNPTFGGTSDANGSSSPSNYSVTLNGNTALGALVRRTDAVNLPIASAPAAPQGTRTVNLNQTTDAVGAWNTVRNLTVNGNVGSVAMPGGAYGAVTVNGQNALVIGTAGATTPTVYDFQSLTLNGQASLQVVGPVVVRLAGNVVINGAMGNASHPEWLTLSIASGGATLNGGTNVAAQLFAPAGTVSINGGASLTGALAADGLVLNGNGLLRVTIGVAVP